MLKAFSSFSSQFVSPLFPGKGEETVFSIVFSERPESVLLRFSSWGRDSIRRKAAVSAFILLSAYIEGEDVVAIADGWRHI